MESFESFLAEFIAFVVLAIAIITIVGAISGELSSNGYSYVDSDGNEGAAQWCSSNKIMLCHSGDKTIQVKEYWKNK